MPTRSADGCPHADRSDEGVCRACGACLHEVILNGACLHCGETALDGIALSPKPAADFVPAGRLKKPGD